MTPPERTRLGRLSRLFTTTAILLPFSLLSQDTITIGTGTQVNGFFSFPAPYGNAANGARHQMLILADELQAAGMGPGNISSVAFEVSQAASVQFNGFTVSIGTTDATEMTEAWIPGLTAVYGPTDFANDQNGWNTHAFGAPFSWDGVSNLVVQTCFSNDADAQNAFHFQTPTTFNSTVVRSTNNTNVCTASTGQLNTYAVRPNMRFEWAQVPPVAGFSQSTTSTCSGLVQFQDLSEFGPDSWLWDFGDGGTDTVQNPEHLYSVNGVYIPVLIAINAFGSDTIEGQPITVNVSGAQPAQACIPASSGTVAGIGILNVTLEANSFASGDAASEGYVDGTCQLTTVPAGSLLDIAIGTGTVSAHNIRVWADWDGNGDLIGTELVLSADNTTSATASVLVPVFAVLDTPLRLRVMADFSFSAYPEPCLDPEFGQAEDYGLIVIANTEPPVAGFSASPTITCDGTVQFMDASLNLPTSWNWDFGDTGTSDQPSPTHVYTASGIYTVSLTVTNADGSDTSTQTDLVTVDLGGQLLPANCTPNTTAYCCGFGITSVEFAGINNTSADGSEGYVDRSCGNTAQVYEGAAFPISIGTGGVVDHDVIAWIDLDNSGSFEANEKVWSALNQQSPAGTLIIPAATAFGVPVRMRVTGDVVGAVSDACDEPLNGQTEDFSVIISPNPNPPTASFTANPTSTCTGYVQFTDASLNAPQSWSWDFGDDQTSTEPSPLHLYAEGGTYTVALTVTNANGSDTETAVDLINVVAPPFCDTITMPDFPPGEQIEGCLGVLADDGGPDEDYSPGPSAPFTIVVPADQVVTLVFSQFEFEDGFDYLRIYDGPDNASPEIGDGFTGSGIDALPQNGVISSTGPSITLQQDASMGPTTWEGFVLNWSCSPVGIEEEAQDPIGSVWPQPAQDRFTVGFGRQSGSGWILAIRNALGALISRTDLDAGVRERIIDSSGLAPGAYLLSVETPHGRWNRTIIIR